MATRSPALSRARPTPRAAFLLLVVVLLAIALVYPARLYMGQRGQLAELERQTQILTDKNQELSRQVQMLHDPEYLARTARECLGMVKPGETAFVVVPKGGDPEPPSC